MKYKIGDSVIIRPGHPNSYCGQIGCQYTANVIPSEYYEQIVVIRRTDTNGRGEHYHAKPESTTSLSGNYNLMNYHISECMIKDVSEVKGVSFINKKINKDFVIPDRTEPLKIPYKQFKLGIELETIVPQEGLEELKTTLRTNRIEFATCGDGSITTDGNGSGVEFKSAHAMTYTELKTDLKKLTEEFQKHEVYVNTSCGYHLHISNKKFFTASNMNKIILAWSALEDVFLATQPRSRTNNSYCKRYLQQFVSDQKNDFKLLKGKGNLISQLSSGSGRDRYITLNLQALERHGTIEIRLHAGTTNYTKVIAWVDLMLSFFTYCLNDYDSKAIHNLFYQPISDLKVNNTLALLGMSDTRKVYFKNRVNKFLFTYLARQQESAGKIMQNIDAVKKARKEYLDSQNKYSKLNTAFEQEYRTLTQAQ